jgi:hypothetical protein
MKRKEGSGRNKKKENNEEKRRFRREQEKKESNEEMEGGTCRDLIGFGGFVERQKIIG